MRAQAAIVVGALACVAFVAGLRNLVDVVCSAGKRRGSTVAVLLLLMAALGAVAVANPEVWLLFVVGFPSLASVVLEAWARAYEGVGRRICQLGARRGMLRCRMPGAWEHVVPQRTARLTRRRA